MRILLDTNALFWFLTEPDRLSTTAKRLIAPTEQEITVSLVSLWELAIKIGKGNLMQAGSSIQYILDEMKAQRIGIMPVELKHILRLEYLPPHHKDPFDRLIIAQALEEQLPVITSDRIFQTYGAQVFW